MTHSGATSEASSRPVPIVLAADEVAIFTIDLANEKLRTRDLLATLDDVEQSAAERFVHPDDRARYEAAHVGLRVVLAACGRTAMDAVIIVRGACGRCGATHAKPVVRNRPDVNFSLAHAGALALVAVATVPVGVDLEPVDRRPAPNLVGVVATPGEVRAVETGGAPPASLLRLWTRKEALLKATGEGLARDPRTVEVGLGGPVTVEGFRVSDVELGVTGYVAAVSWEGTALRRLRLGAVVDHGDRTTCVLDP